MTDETKTFDIFDDKGAKLADAKPSPVTISNLTPNTEYNGWQIAYAGQSDKAAIPAFKTLDVVADAPAVELAAGNSLVNFKITEGNNRGSAVTNHKVYYTDGTNSGTVSSQGLTGTINNLTNDVEYTVQAVSVNGAGESDKSPAVKATPKAPVIKMTSFDIDHTTISGKVGDTGKLTVSNPIPDNAADKAVNATVEDETVATIRNNADYTFTVSYLKPGTTIAHYVSQDGGAKKDVTINVTEA